MVESIVYTVAAIAGCVLTVQDIMHERVHVILLLCFMASCFAVCCIDGRSPCFMPLLIMLLIGCVYYAIRKASCFGAADYFALFSTSFLYDPDNWPLFITICGGLGILTFFLFQNRRFPFIPAILASGFITRFLDSPR